MKRLAKVVSMTVQARARDPVAMEINDLHEELWGHAKSSLAKAIRIGELLTKQKQKTKHGDWLLWIETNLVFDERTARNYITVWKSREISERLSDLTSAYRLLGGRGKTIATGFTGDQESYTPEEYIEVARSVMGTIDLDPASNPKAQEVVRAKTYYDEETDGLSKTWNGNVFLNPPYAGKAIRAFVSKLLDEINSDRVKQAILLTNDNTDTEWFQDAASAATYICLLRGRINFYKQDDSTTSPTNGQTFFYFGNRGNEFRAQFGKRGLIAKIVDGSTKHNT